MNKSYTILLRVFREWLFEGSCHVFSSLSEVERLNFCRLAAIHRLQAFTAYFTARCKVDLPPEVSAEFLRHYHASAARDLPREVALKKIYKILENAGIDYIPLKGSFLAYHAYPAPGLRPRSDVDLLIRNRDLDGVKRVFFGEGWSNMDDRPHTLHIPSLVSPDGKTLLEPHFAIFQPGFGAITNDKLWSVATSFAGHQYTLPPEIILLHALDNALGDELKFGFKPLMDTAMLIAKFKLSGCDLIQARKEFCPRADVGLLFSAFPEFYPDEFQKYGSSAPPEVIDAFRALPLTGNVEKANSYEVLLNVKYKSSGLSGRVMFLIDRMFAHPAEIKKRYRLPQNAFWRLPIYYFTDFFRKAAIFFKINAKTSTEELVKTTSRQFIIKRYIEQQKK